mgnify:CR=1 FL=1
MNILIKQTEVYRKWFNKLDFSLKLVIIPRLSRIEQNGYFGQVKSLGEISEIKFKNGLRIYFGRDGENVVLLLSGGDKNNKKEQSRDIAKAKEIWKEYLDYGK